MSSAAHEPSYYAATRHKAGPWPTLTENLEADVCVIGGGFSGIATALTLAERGKSVIVLEANLIGWGATGRNGGQALAGWSGEDQFVKQAGPGAEEFLWRTRYLGNEIIEERMRKYGIECDYRMGAATAALNQSQVKALREEYDACVRNGMGEHVEMLGANDLPQIIGSKAYVGALVDRRSAHCHPLNLCLGEAKAASDLGVRIFENSAVIELSNDGDKEIVRTDTAQVRAPYVVLAGNAYHRLEVARLNGLMLPAQTYMMATEPLSDELAHSVLPGNHAICDANIVLDYYRLTADKRLLFGGECTYSNRRIADIKGAMTPRMHKIFPQLSDAKIEFEWGGVLGIPLNRVPLIGKSRPNVYFAQGYSGHGVTCSHVVAEILSDAIEARFDDLDLFERVSHFRIPLADTIGSPLLALGMTYYRMRDALGV